MVEGQFWDGMSKSVICCLGGPGSGKGTQAGWAAEEYKLGLVVAGEVLREEAKEDTERGKTIAWHMANQRMVDPGLFLDVIKRKLEESASRNVLLDGCPRSIAQLEAQFGSIGRRTAVVYLEVPDEELVGRLSERAGWSGRADDVPEAIPKRIAMNKKEEENLPTLERLEGEGIPFERVDGVGTVEEVRARFVGVLRKYWRLG